MQILDTSDLGRLAKDYHPGESAEVGFHRQISVSLPALDRLAEAIDADMDENIHGVRWWQGHPIGDRRRILASDHMLECVRSIEINVREARLHQMSWRHCTNVADARLRDVVSVVRRPDGSPDFAMKHPRSERGMDDLAHHLADLHAGGFLRAVGSAMDCLGGGIIGVLGVPEDLLKADLDRVRRWFKQGKAAQGSSFASRFFRNAGLALEAIITAAGPAGWASWTSDMRNMLVHRGRRYQMGMFVPRKLGGVDARGLPKVITEVVHHLPSAPSHSDVEAMMATAGLDQPTPPPVSNLPADAPLLTEGAGVTFEGIFNSTTALVEGASALLLRAWMLRRADPAAVVQPREQWKNTPPAAPAPAFPGYAPGVRSRWIR